MIFLDEKIDKKSNSTKILTLSKYWSKIDHHSLIFINLFDIRAMTILCCTRCYFAIVVFTDLFDLV